MQKMVRGKIKFGCSGRRFLDITVEKFLSLSTSTPNSITNGGRQKCLPSFLFFQPLNLFLGGFFVSGLFSAFYSSIKCKREDVPCGEMKLDCEHTPCLPAFTIGHK